MMTETANPELKRSDLALEIVRLAHLTGEFKLRSGQISNEYFDKYRFEAQPQVLKAIAEQMASLIPPDCEILAGLEMGGIPVATALSLHTGLPLCFVRKEAKDYGTCRLAEGLELKDKKACVVEDVITTGGQVVTSCRQLRDLGASIESVICVIDRSKGDHSKLTAANLQLKALFTMEELLG